MAEASFEARLERMFGEAPAMRDADLFTFRVLDRVDRGWTTRRLLIGAMGLAGGLIGAVQLVGSGIGGQLQALGAESNAYLTRGLAEAVPTDWLPAGVTLNSQVVWMTLALAAVAAGLGVARAIREI